MLLDILLSPLFYFSVLILITLGLRYLFDIDFIYIGVIFLIVLFVMSNAIFGIVSSIFGENSEITSAIGSNGYMVISIFAITFWILVSQLIVHLIFRLIRFFKKRKDIE